MGLAFVPNRSGVNERVICGVTLVEYGLAILACSVAFGAGAGKAVEICGGFFGLVRVEFVIARGAGTPRRDFF